MSDNLYPQAVALVRQDNKASAAYLQRKLHLGFNAATALLERMEAEGIVSAANHVGLREVLVLPTSLAEPQADHIADDGNMIAPTEAPAKPAYTGPVEQFTCSSCDTSDYGPADGLPDGWYPQIIEKIGTILRCPTCAERHATRIATSTMTTEEIMSAGQDGEQTDKVTAAAQGRLKSYMERLIRLREEALEVAEDMKEVMAEAKGEGFDNKVMRKLLTEMLKDSVKRQDEKALLELYASAVGFDL